MTIELSLVVKKLTQQKIYIYFSLSPPIMFNEEISFFIKLFSIVFLGLFSGVDAETFSWQKSWRVSSYVGIIWCVGRFSTTTSKYLLTIHRSAALKFAKKGKKNIRVKSLFTKKSVVFCRIIDTFASKWL